MKNPIHHSIKTGSAMLVLFLAGCGGDPQSPGIEYMPDMYRSPAIEAYVDYGQDPYHHGEDVASDQRERPSARVPAEGTIPFSLDTSKARFNMPYPYPNSNEGYEAAGLEVRSPIPMTEATVTQGKVIYDKFCLHCHGGTGMGDGPVVSKGGHPPPLPYNGALKDLPEGKMFHTITYGKGMMGPHAPLLNKEERWLVVQYVKYLQADQKLPNGAKLGGGGAPAVTDSTQAAGTAAATAGTAPAPTNNAPAGTM